MSDPFEIIKDSSIWFNSGHHAVVRDSDSLIRLGTVKLTFNDKITGELRYLVEIQKCSDRVELNCRMMRRFGGVYNYEDYIFQGYKINDKPDPVSASEAKAGDQVLVCFLNGNGREGVILGGVSHAARRTAIQATSGPQYKTEFNGIETSINKDGEYIMTFKGQPTNLARLNDIPKDQIAAATYDTSIGTSFYMFDKTGSYIVSDNSQTGIQSINLDKPNGVLKVLSGGISLKLTKNVQSVEWLCKTIDTKATDKVSIETKEFTVDSTTRVYIKTPKVAIGTDAIELLDQLAKLIDALGTVQPISPIGNCTSLKSSPGWPGVDSVKAKIKQITGSF